MRFRAVQHRQRPEFERLEAEAAAGRLTKDAFVASVIRCEFRAAEKTRAFYVHVFLPWAHENRVPSDATLWYIGIRPDCRDCLFLPLGDNWSYYERQYDSIVAGRGRLQKGTRPKEAPLKASKQ